MVASGFVSSVCAGISSATESGEEYFCGVAQKEGEYYIIDLHFTNRAAPKDWKGSTLVGYYGVHWKDGIIVEWDVIAEAPGKPVTSRKPNQPIQSITDNFGASPLRV